MMRGSIGDIGSLLSICMQLAPIARWRLPSCLPASTPGTALVASHRGSSLCTDVATDTLLWPLRQMARISTILALLERNYGRFLRWRRKR